MFNIEMTFNGKPFSESNFEEAILQAVVETAKEKIISILTENEASQIKIDVVGENLDDLSLNLNGPEEIVKKVQDYLS